MIPKIIHLEPYFPTGELTVQPVVLWANGRACYEGISKHASVGTDYFKTIQPVPGHSFVYVLAVSSWETYGENRNGDSFPEHPYKEHENPPWITPQDVLPLHYKSFEQFGYNYRHHCFPAGSSVLRGDRIRAAIEEIQIGDTVETLEGTKRVINIMHRPYAGPGVQLSLRGNFDPLVGTADHPVLVYRREQVHCPHRYNYLTVDGRGCSVNACQEKRGSIGDPEWVPLNSVLPGDYLVFPKPKHGEEKVDPAFARLVGWVASEGHLSNRGIIQFTFSAENTKDLSSVKECLEENGLYAGTCPRPQYGLTTMTACSSEVHAQLSYYVTGVLSEKHLTEMVLKWDEESLLQLLGAYVDGDGHVATTGKNAGQLRIRSSSPQMLRILSDIIKSLGVPATVQWDSPEGTMVSPTNGKVYPTSGSGVVAIESAHSPYIAKYSRKKFVRGGRTPQTITVGDIFLVQVTEREDVELNEEVFNLEVEGAHHYIVNEVIVHNCNKDPAKAVGKVMRAFWNPTMHRVELMVDLENEKAPDLVERIANGEFPPVSMGTRVMYDVCSICGNRAPTRAQYCDHLKFQMRDVIEGKKVSALNPSPKFFDISWVFRGADPAAFMLKKVAEHAYDIISGAAAGEYIDQMTQTKNAARKMAVIDKVVQGVPIDARSYGIDPHELSNLCNIRDTVSIIGKRIPELPDSLLRGLSGFSLPKIFSSLMASGGMMLSTPEVVKVTIYKVYPKASVDDSIINRTVASQGGILKLFEDYPQLLEKLRDTGVLDMGVEHVDSKIAEMVVPYMEKRSGIPEYLKRKLIPEAWRDDPAQTMPLTMTDPSSGMQYGTTIGAATRAHDEIAKSNLKKVLGGAALLTGAYKLIGTGLDYKGFGKLKPLAALGLGALGVSQWPSMGRHYMTDQGVPIPTMTELAKTSADTAMARSLALPLLGTLGAMALMSHDYQSRLRSGVPIGYEGQPWGRRLLDQVEEFSDEHPLVTGLTGVVGLRQLGKTIPAKLFTRKAKRVWEPVSETISGAKGRSRQMLKELVEQEKLSAYMAGAVDRPTSTVMLPDIDLEKVAMLLGDLILNG